MSESFRFLLPALALSASAFVLWAIDAIMPVSGKLARRSGFGVAALGLLIALWGMPFPMEETPHIFGRGMLIWDGLAYFTTGLGILTTLLVLLLTESHRAFQGLRLSVYYGLMIMATAGVAMIGMSNDFLMIFIAIELVGVPSFILTGYSRSESRSAEAALKFFLIGAFSSAMLVYGLSLLYGILGSTSLDALAGGLATLEAQPALAITALLFILVSFAFKVAMVPFHMWVPDVFEGAPAPVAAFLSVAPKMAGAALVLRIFSQVLLGLEGHIFMALAVLAALTMTIGNVIGLRQNHAIRLLAYSSIAHMGYLLLGIIAGGGIGAASFYLYGLAYWAMNLGAFAIVIAWGGTSQSYDLSAFAGMATRAPALSALLALFLVSLTGIPPTVGFFAKFYVMSAAYQAGWLWLVIATGINTAIAAGYYFKILRTMYFDEAVEGPRIELSWSTRTAIALASFFTLLIGLFPQMFLNQAQRLAGAATVIQKTALPCCAPENTDAH